MNSRNTPNVKSKTMPGLSHKIRLRKKILEFLDLKKRLQNLYKKRKFQTCIVGTPPPPFFLKAGKQILITSPRGGKSEKLKKGGGSMMQGAGLLKREAGTFPI